MSRGARRARRSPRRACSPSPSAEQRLPQGPLLSRRRRLLSAGRRATPLPRRDAPRPPTVRRLCRVCMNGVPARTGRVRRRFPRPARRRCTACRPPSCGAFLERPERRLAPARRATRRAPPKALPRRSRAAPSPSFYICIPRRRRGLRLRDGRPFRRLRRAAGGASRNL